MYEVVTIQQAVMAEDEKYALRIRETLRGKKIFSANIIGSPGCGKTTLLEQTGGKAGFSFAVIEGDLETSRDAERLAAVNVKALQINTKGWCHLEAHVIEKALSSILSTPNLDASALDMNTPDSNSKLDAIFIENVGNLVCPAEFDLGEDVKVAVSSVPEGADKPLKYPMLFAQAGIVLLTKTDLLPYVRFDMEMFMRDVRTLNPKCPIVKLDLMSGAGMDEWLSFISDRIQEKRGCGRR